ncbi:RNA-directed DNA polymerase, eukaryota [Tanacetum coccineum]
MLSPTDGYTFEFFRKYWNIVSQDLVAAVYEFFSSSKFPQGRNSSFIALIPKIHDAKDVKDFLPISLIGSLYKIIAKFLANRLSLVISDLISDVQSSFISNSFDSVRWDYLDDVLKSFGFGDKWRGWIFGCLDSAMGSALINGSPTMEFQFHKGLKQGDPLSQFLFILVIESLHISFNRVLDADLYKGISINNSLTISHLFYANDAIFVSKWDINNIKTIVNVLNGFFMDLGLKINIHKSKLAGIGVSKENIDFAANIMGCSTSSPPFNYLGIKVGAPMSRLNSWKDITAKISLRLSEWKLKSLSIGGRYTLLKSVFTSIPIYHMSLFKVPAGNLKEMESLRRNLFNGMDRSEKKMVWIRWEKLLASKKNGGLGISSFFATNHALLFKWMWQFITQGSSLSSNFIKAIHGDKGAIDNLNSPSRTSLA